MIPFNRPPITGNEKKYVDEVYSLEKLSGNGRFTGKCSEWFRTNINAERTILTPSCTHALEMCAILADVKEGDEIIMPSYTFVSTANAFVMRGAKIVFADVQRETMNIDPECIRRAVTDKTKAIVVVHYAGVVCDMDEITRIADENGVLLIEDAAQAIMSTYKGRYAGTFGHLAAFSFHETKNCTAGGEGGMLVVNDASLFARARIIQEKGTNRYEFMRGETDKYTWVDIGSSYLISELQAAFLYGQLEMLEEINRDRMRAWRTYASLLQPLQEKNLLELPFIPAECEHNAHMFYIKTESQEIRTKLLQYLREKEIAAVFHYIPLHSSPAGLRYSTFSGDDRYTTSESVKLLRLPVWYGISSDQLQTCADGVKDFYKQMI